MDCAPLLVGLFFIVLQGVGVIFSRVLKLFDFGLHTKCLLKSPNEPPACLEGEVCRPGH
jgi:hypothetical protein